MVLSLDLSICIVNWNCREYLRALLLSIESERDDLRLEAIVVDNASTDDSVSMVTLEFPDICLIRNDRHQGIAKANNQAAALARGQLLLFLNNDTVIRPGALTRLVDFIERHPEISAVGPSLVSRNGKRQITARKTLSFQALLHRVLFLRWTHLFRSAEREYRQVDFNPKQNAYAEHLVGAALLVRREQFIGIGGWDEAFEFGLDDVDLSMRLSRLGKMYYLAEAQVNHWGGIARNLDEVFVYRCNEYSYLHYIRKYYGPGAAQVYKLLITLDMPFRVGILALRWLAQRLLGKRARASRSARRLAAASQFLLFGLPRYWRA